MVDTGSPTTRPSAKPGLPLVGAVAIAVGLTIVVAAVLAAIVGDKTPTPPATTRAATGGSPSSPSATTGGVSDPQRYQLVTTRDGSLDFEAPAEWTTLVQVSGTAGNDQVVGAGAVSTSLDDYKAARTDGIVAVVTGPGESTSAGLAGAIIGNSSVFCPPTACTTGKPAEKDVQLESPVTQVDSQFTVSEPAVDGGPGELRYTIETAAPTRYVVMIVRAADPAVGSDVLEHALGTLSVR